MHKMTTLYWMEPEQLSCVSGSSKPWFNTTPFIVPGMGLGLHSSGSKCSRQKEFLGNQGMLSLDKANISAKHRSIISTTYKKKRRFYNERRQPSQTFRNPNGFFALHFYFPAKSGQIPAGKNWQISISLWVINSEKRAVSKPVLCIVLVSVSVAINNQNWKYLVWLQYPFLSLAIQRYVPTLISVKQLTRIRSSIWQAEIFDPNFYVYTLLSTYNHHTHSSWQCFQLLKGTTHSKWLAQTKSKKVTNISPEMSTKDLASFPLPRFCLPPSACAPVPVQLPHAEGSCALLPSTATDPSLGLWDTHHCTPNKLDPTLKFHCLNFEEVGPGSCRWSSCCAQQSLSALFHSRNETSRCHDTVVSGTKVYEVC